MAEEFTPEKAKEIIEGGVAQAQELMSDPAKMDELLQQIKQQVADLPETFTGAMANVPLMAEMVKSYITKEYTNVSPKVVASLVAVFLYLVKQKDIIPDNVPVLGIADDLAVVAAAMKLNEAELTDYANWRTANNLPETTQA
jgi:uncharacterized membrane protein YkvA (DUF1232 family)